MADWLVVLEVVVVTVDTVQPTPVAGTVIVAAGLAEEVVGRQPVLVILDGGNVGVAVAGMAALTVAHGSVFPAVTTPPTLGVS